MPKIDLESAAHEVTRLLDGVRDDQLADPTPCPGTPVAALLDHFMTLSMAFTWAARKTPGAGGPPPPMAAEHLDPNWRAELPRRLAELAEAWRDPRAWEGMADAGGVSMPAAEMGVVALDELTLHGWDLARATGQRFNCSPADAAAILAFTEASARPEHEAARQGLFGPVVPVPDDAPVFDRALGYAGRDPGWTPPAAA